MEKYLSCSSYVWLCINFGKEDETRNDTIKKFSVIIGVRTQQKQKFRSHLDLWPSKPATFKLPVLFRKFYHRPICHRCSGGGEMALRDIFCSNVFNLWKMVSSRAKAMSKTFFRKVDDRETNRPGLILRALKGHYDVLANKHTTQSCGVSATLGGDFLVWLFSASIWQEIFYST